MATIIGYSPGVRNKFPNPSAENGAASYGYCGSTMTGGGFTPSVAWLTAVTEKAWVGNYSTKLSIPAGAISAVNQTYTMCIALSGAAFTGWEAGEPYSFGIHYQKSTANIRVQIRIMWRTGTTILKNTTYSAMDDSLGTAGDWVNYYIEGDEMPAGTDNVYFYLTITALTGSVGQAVNLWFDGGMIVKGPMVPYIDGNQGPNYHWSGTVNNSESYRDAVPIYGPSGSGGLILMEPQLFKATRDNVLTDDISPYILSGSIEMKTDREIKMQFKGTFRNQIPVDPYTEYLAPFIKLTLTDGQEITQQMGLYSIAPPAEEITEENWRGSFQAYDLTWNLSEASLGIPFTVAAGTNIIQSARNLLNNFGFTRWSIPDHPATFATARTWETDKSILTILNDHFEAVGFYTLHANKIGIMTTFPYIDLATSEPAITLRSGEGSMVINTIKRERLADGIINMVRILKEGAAAGSISYTQTNSNPLSPVSTVRLGRVKFKEYKYQELASLDVAKAKAAQILQDAASLYTRYVIQTIPDPRHEVWEVIDTDIHMTSGNEVVSGKLRVTGWDFGFTPAGAAMSIHASRLEPF